MSDSWLDQVKWNDDGLVPAIARDVDSGQVLMMAWMNREALALTRETGHAVYWSRSRGKLWHKGEYYLRVEDMILIKNGRAESLTSFDREIFQL